MEDYVTVKTFQNRFNAEIALAFLAAQGIKAIISSDDTGRARPYLSHSANSLFLKVAKKDLQKAKELFLT